MSRPTILTRVPQRRLPQRRDASVHVHTLLTASLLLMAAGCGSVAPVKFDAGEPGQSTSADAGDVPDGGLVPDAGGDAASRCTDTEVQASCSYQTLVLDAAGMMREVHHAVPLGDPPTKGWPVVIYYQGSFIGSEGAFGAERDARFGQYFITRTVKALLDAGFAVLAPEALLGGATYWQTNIPPWSTSWTASADHAFITAILDAIAAGRFGRLDESRLYAMGISSGGFMTSRMAVSYPGRFRALAISAGSYATCSGTCSLPATLPADHPPTLFLHGENDSVVPTSSMTVYRDALLGQGTEVETVLSDSAGHEWLSEGPAAIVPWFVAHP